MQPELLFRSVHELQNPQAFDLVSQGSVAVPSCHVLVAGIVCKGRSNLNMHRKTTVRCVRDEATETGQTAAAVREYARIHQPKLIIFENVPGLDTKDATGTSSLDDLSVAFGELGYSVTGKPISGRSFGMPVNRDRLYILCMKDVEPGFDKLLLQSVTLCYEAVKVGTKDLKELLIGDAAAYRRISKRRSTGTSSATAKWRQDPTANPHAATCFTT